MMQFRTNIPTDIRYNAATNMFEALVAVTTDHGQSSYPCAVHGALSMPLKAAAFKLTQHAKQQHLSQNGLRAETVAHDTAVQSMTFRNAA
jgi:hypothetical protein